MTTEKKTLTFALMDAPFENGRTVTALRPFSNGASISAKVRVFFSVVMIAAS